MKKIIFILVAVLFVVGGCKKSPDNTGGQGGDAGQFIAKMTSEGVFANNASVFTKNEEKHQTSVNAVRGTYCIQSDDQTQYVSMVLGAGADAVGKSTTIIFKTSGIERVTLKNATYDVELVQLKDGLAWYWCADEAAGFVMPKF